jgi:hypothetical protein
VRKKSKTKNETQKAFEQSLTINNEPITNMEVHHYPQSRFPIQEEQFQTIFFRIFNDISCRNNEIINLSRNIYKFRINLITLF